MKEHLLCICEALGRKGGGREEGREDESSISSTTWSPKYLWMHVLSVQVHTQSTHSMQAHKTGAHTRVHRCTHTRHMGAHTWHISTFIHATQMHILSTCAHMARRCMHLQMPLHRTCICNMHNTQIHAHSTYNST